MSIRFPSILSLRITTLALAGASLLALGACESEEAPVEPNVMARQSAQRVVGMSRSAASAIRGAKTVGRTSGRLLDSASGAARTLERVPSPVGGSSAPITQPLVLDQRLAFVNERPMLMRALLRMPGFRSTLRPFATRSLLGPDETPLRLAEGDANTETAMDIEDGGDNLARFLEERILVDANLESSSDSEAIYKLKPNPTCLDLDDPTIVDGNCEETLTKLEVRIRLTRDDTGARFELLIGSERARPVALRIDETLLSLGFYLDGLKQAMLIAARDLGEPEPVLPLMKGSVWFTVRKLAEAKIAFETSVGDAIEVGQGDLDSDPAAFLVRTAKAEPAFSVTVDGANDLVEGAMDIRETEVLIPWNVRGTVVAGAKARLFVGGLSASVTFTPGQDQLVLSNLGLGTLSSFFETRGQRIVQVDLNPQHGRKFTVTLDAPEAGAPSLAFTPRFHLVTDFNLGAIAADFDAQPASYLLDESYDFAFTPASGVDPVLESVETATDSALRVKSGELSLASSRAQAPVIVTAGQCLTSVEPAAGSHPLLGSLSAGACPN